MLLADAAVDVVCFFEIDGDDAREVAGGDGGVGDVADDVEGETGVGVFGERAKGEAHIDEGAEGAALGGFDAAPEGEIAGAGEVRDGAVEAAGEAEVVGGVGRNEPITDVVACAVGAESGVVCRQDAVGEGIETERRTAGEAE